MSGIFMSSGYNGPKETRYLFVDGGCWRQMIEDAAKRYSFFDATQIDYAKVFGGFSKTFYYDSMPPQKNGESNEDYAARIKPMEELFNDLRTIPGVHVYEGSSRRRRRTVQQKKVDIMIAVDMLTHSFRRNMHQATLLTADLDFKPLIDALVQDGMHVDLLYPHGKPNKELLYAADARRPLTFRELHAWCKTEFQESYSFEVSSGLKGRNDEKDLVLKETWTRNDIEIELYQVSSKNIYVIMFPDRASRRPNYYFKVKHSDSEVLKTFVEECFQEFWDTLI
ncbi:MAG: NYN domain-containing protein [Saprospiraceae bacterium]|nr:NYN domain-containing protein [Lewinella sp.]